MSTQNDGRAVSGHDVAVVAMAGRFPGATNVEEYWHNLVNGVEGIERFGATASAAETRPLDGAEVAAAARLKDIELFDAGFFGFSPTEAELMDPQHRLFLECASEVLERAGHDPDRFPGLIGVYAGMGANTYLRHVLGALDVGDAALGLQSLIGNDKDYLATMVSYKLNLRGPSMTVQTACSTSLVAVHLACQALLDYECDMAVAGGVSIRSPQPVSYRYSEGSILSPDGYCRAFDARAAGTLFGNGLGAVVLRRLEDALEDGDQIHAVIRGSAVNNDGSGKVGYTAPSVGGQVAMITTALARADVDPASIRYIEAHGTGTVLGDPIEVAALTEAFRTKTDATGFCGLGSVKTNIGHLDAAAGIAGLIKAVLALKNRVIPPTLHYREPNPRVPLEGSPFYVVATATPWVGPSPRRAAVNSLGIGGTNAHVILEEAPSVPKAPSTRSCHVFPLSARSSDALDEASRQLAAHLAAHPALDAADVAYTLQAGRRVFSHRRVVVCETLREAATALAAGNRRVVSGVQAGPASSVAFMFPGGGAHHVNMASGLYRTEVLFRQHFDECLGYLPREVAHELKDLLYPDAAREADASQRLLHTSVALPALFAVEYALARVLMEWGIRPQAMVGHSLGEYTAACLAGVFTLPDALALVVRRSQLLDSIEPGSMLSVAMAEDELRPLLPPHLSIAAVNAPTLCVVSGSAPAIRDIGQELSAKGVDVRPLHIAVAAHSPLVEPVLDTFRDFVAALPRRVPQIPLVSDVTGTWMTPGEATSVEYWVRHLRETVRFSDGVGTLLENGRAVLLEIGPGVTLAALAREHPGSRGSVILSSMRHPQSSDADERVLLGAIGQLWIAGVPVDWNAHQKPARPARVLLPTYPFERSRFWIGPEDGQPQHPRGERRRMPLDEWCHVATWKQSIPPGALPHRSLPPDGSWLIFCDAAGLGDSVAECLQGRGERVLRVTSGDEFRRISSDAVVINADRQADYELLFDNLDRAHPPHTIVHLRHAGEPPVATSNGGAGPANEMASFDRMLFLAQAAHRGGLTNVHVALCASRLARVLPGEIVCPATAALAAPCRVMAQEYADMTTRWVDVAVPKSVTKRRRLAEVIVEELHREPGAQAIAYRGAQRWVQGFDRVLLRGGTPSRLRPGGVYLVTGGLGALGLILARHLASAYHARLVLAGRTALPPRDEWNDWLAVHPPDDHGVTVLRTIMELESGGAEIHTIQADVSDPSDVQRMFDEARSRFGRLDGIFHLAGVPGAGVMQLKTPGASAAVFAPKIAGTRHILDACRWRGVEFVVLFSSITSVVGGVGQSDYCAAGAYMDALAGISHGTDVIAIHWDAWQADRWQDAALVALPEIREQARRWRAQVGIRPEEGMEMLGRVLASGLQRAIVSVQDLTTAIAAQDRTLKHAARAPAESARLREAARLPGVAYVAPTTNTEKRVVAVWEQILGVAGIGVHDTFISLGGHSLLMLQVVARLRQELDADVPLRALFERPTVAELAAFIDSGHGDTSTIGSGDEELAALLDEVENLTPEQVRSELAAIAAPVADNAGELT